MSLSRTMARLQESLDFLEGKPIKRKRFRPTPRDKVTAHLAALGFHVFSDDIKALRGYWTHAAQDCLDRWSVYGTQTETGKRVEITGIDTLTLCAKRGIEIEPNPPDSQYYGDFVASAKKTEKSS